MKGKTVYVPLSDVLTMIVLRIRDQGLEDKSETMDREGPEMSM